MSRHGSRSAYPYLAIIYRSVGELSTRAPALLQAILRKTVPFERLLQYPESSQAARTDMGCRKQGYMALLAPRVPIVCYVGVLFWNRGQGTSGNHDFLEVLLKSSSISLTIMGHLTHRH